MRWTSLRALMLLTLEVCGYDLAKDVEGEEFTDGDGYARAFAYYDDAL